MLQVSAVNLDRQSQILLATIDAQRAVTAAAQDREQVLEVIARQAVAAFATADGAVVELVAGTDLDYVAAAGTLAPHLGVRLPIAGSLSGVAMSQRTTVRCVDSELDRRVNQEACRRVGLRSMCIAPLFSGDRPIGVLKISSAAPRAFDEGDVYQLELLAGSLSAALRHAEEYARNATLLAERTQALAALEASEQRFRVAFDNSPLGMVLTSLHPATMGWFLQVNPAMAAITGYSLEQLTRMGATTLHHPDDVADTMRTLRRLARGEIDTASMEKRYRHAGGGDDVWVRIRTAVARDPHGEPLYLVSQIEDITAARAAQRALHQSEERFHAQFTHSAVGQLVLGLNGTILDANPAFAAMLGRRAEVLLGSPAAELLDPDTAELSRTMLAELLGGGRDAYNHEGRLRHAAGGWVDVEATVSVVRDPEGHPLHLIGVVVDISARKRAERSRDAAAAELAERNTELEAANQLKLDLIGMLGHEIGTPLTSILGYTELALAEWAELDDARRRGTLDAVHRNARRLDGIVREVLALVAVDAGRLTAHPQRVAVREHLEGAVGQAPGGHRPAIDCPAALAALAQPGHLDQILVNLLSNADKYAGGATRVVACQVGDAVEIRVEDSGPGVPPQFREHLFERFARADSTAGTVRGTGLGLYIARELARANRGDVHYRPASPTGSAFTLRLPAPGQPPT